MPRKKSGLFDNKAYQNDYHKAMKTKLLSFNPANADDMVLWDYILKQGNVSGYIKRLIRADIKNMEVMNMKAKEIIEKGYYEAAVQLMDDEIREEIHRELAPCTDLEFLEEYMKRHEQKYDTEFTI